MKKRLITFLIALLLTVTAAVMAGCAPVTQPDGQGGGETSADSGNTPQDKPGQGTGPADSEPALSEEDAIKIVLDRVPGSEKSEIISFGRDYEDGRWEYDGKLVHDGIEYEFEIDAQNGNILEWELDD